MKQKNGKNGEFHHKRSLGQNFLTDDALFEQLVSISGVSKKDCVLEIGAGAGGMTRALSKACKHVISIEVDGTLLPILRVALENCKNVELVHGDVLRLNLPEITKKLGNYHVVANIPYYLTTELMNLLLTSGMPIASINLMVQKEAADRMVARPGEEGYGMLAVRAQYAYAPEIAMDVPACLFTPPPKVDSAFVVMPRRERPLVEVTDETMFFRVAAAAFAMRRKTMENNLIASFRISREEAKQWLEDCGISSGARGETLSLQDFATLANYKSKTKE
ncbi:MAG: ribosomal RNA small subunit methyltransferase A [Clostridia bacterium]|nr:ribosomal RNA small subunit methyltransferase A [Clostridia bacterium]MBQ6803626.1 ribosomal RNA small subunit methyltransferase A [Clostridia bacterium]